MNLQTLTLPDWLPWWALVLVMVPVAIYLALFLMMPFQTFGLRGRIAALEGRIDELHEEVRGLTLRLPERGLDPYDGPGRAPPIPPAGREAGLRGGSLGDPVADRMLAYMRDKAQADLQRAEMGRPEPRPEPRAEHHPESRAEPRVRVEPRPRAEPQIGARMAELPPPPPLPIDEPGLPGEAPPRPPRVPGRFGRLPRSNEGASEPRGDWPR